MIDWFTYVCATFGVLGWLVALPIYYHYLELRGDISIFQYSMLMWLWGAATLGTGIYIAVELSL